MAQVPIYTIGHGNRSLEDFVSLLQYYQIRYLVDVRSQPYSRYVPHFSKAILEQALYKHNFHYLYLGDMLGGRPVDPSCYSDGKADYLQVREKPWYLQGIQRLHIAWEKQLAIVVMCSELKPQECHRGKLIGNSLLERGIAVSHIDEFGQLRTQQEVNVLLTGGQPLLFEDISPIELHGKIGRARKKVHPPQEDL